MTIMIVRIGFLIIGIISFAMGLFIKHKSETSYPHFLATQKMGGDKFYMSYYTFALISIVIGFLALPYVLEAVGVA